MNSRKGGKEIKSQKGLMLSTRVLGFQEVAELIRLLFSELRTEIKVTQSKEWGAGGDLGNRQGGTKKLNVKNCHP